MQGVWLSLKAWPEHLSKYHFCSWRLRSNLFLAICWLILSLISLSCIWYGHICSWQIQLRDKPDKSISDRIQLWLDHVSGHERSSKRGKGSKQRRNQRPELQPEMFLEPSLERVTRKGTENRGELLITVRPGVVPTCYLIRALLRETRFG